LKTTPFGQNFFLTGSTGFIGQSLVRAMPRRDWAVLVRDQKGTAASTLDVEIVMRKSAI